MDSARSLRFIFEQSVSLREQREFAELDAFLTRYGWGVKNLAGNVSIAHLSPCRRFVLKYSRQGRCMNLVSRADLQRFPILSDYWLRPLFASAKVAIQCFASPVGKGDSVPLRNRLFAEYGSYMDVCDNNVGYWRNKLRVFDCTPPQAASMKPPLR